MGRKTKYSAAGVALAILVAVVNETVLKPESGKSKTNYANSAVEKTDGIDYGSVEDDHPSESLAATVLTSDVKKQLNANSVHFNGTGAFVLNDNKTSLDASVTTANYVSLSKVDQLGRPGVANAMLSKAARQYQSRTETGNDSKISPVGWHQLEIKGKYNYLYNRGHSIGYAIAGNVKSFDASEANRQNITTQTAWANQASNGDESNTGQNYYETLVRKALDKNKRVRYRVTPIYDGNNLLPAGTKLEAKSSDTDLVFNVFVPNVQPGVAIDYATGNAKLVN
jgi:DNA-entry nuclease